MKRNGQHWIWLLAGGLLATSVVVYVLQIVIFDDSHATFFYIFQDLAFLPLTVLIVGLFIERLITVREKKALVHKLNIVRAAQFARSLDCKFELELVDRAALKKHLVSQRHFVLRLLENPNLMEHERFTDLLWAVHHLEEELQMRTTLTDLVPADEAHLEVDARRAFNALVAEWLVYVQHLKSDYPYLFSMVVRTHPFQETPSPIVTA
jgi:hypothetical protein